MSGYMINNVLLDEISEEEFLGILEQLEQEEADELKQLRAIQRKEVREEQRLLRLEERERKRKEREEERKRREQERLRENCQALLGTWQATQQQIEQAIATREDMLKRFPGLQLPDVPALPEPPQLADTDLTEQDLQTMNDALQSLYRIAQNYQQQVDESLMEYHRNKAARNSAAEIEAWSSKFSARAIRTASDVIATLEQPAFFIADQQCKIRLDSLCNRAKEIMNEYCRSPGNDGDTELSNEIIIILDDVLNAQNEVNAQHALALLRQELREHSKERQRLEKMKHRQKMLEKKRAQTELLAAAMAHTLENMGYTVSGIEDAVFAQNGELYAMLPDDFEHAMRFSFNPTNTEFVSSPVRIKDADQVTGEADKREIRAEDKAFDAHWCNEASFDVKEALKRQGMEMIFERQHAPGELALDQVEASRLGELLQQERNVLRSETQLREKTRKS